MIITNSAGPIESSLTGQINSAMIKANAQAFQVLSSNLYQDKPLAILRELSANALDAHIAANNTETPFKVVLPSRMRRELHIIDYGTGLDHESVLELYMTYFGSSKNGSNIFTGGLGLGSKTPFAYTDTFSVISKVDGVKRSYIAFKDTDGMPKIALMEETSTVDHNGLEVIVPIQEKDHIDFTQKASKALSYFPETSYTLIGATPTPVKYEFKTPTFGLRVTSSDSRLYSNWGVGQHERCRVVMGPIAYPINWNALPASEAPFKAFRRLNDIDLFGQVGDFDVQASREALSYDKHTIKNLASHMSRALAEMRGIILEQAGTEETPFLRAAKALSLQHKLGGSLSSETKTLIHAGTLPSPSSDCRLVEVGNWSHTQRSLRKVLDPLIPSRFAAGYSDTIDQPVFIYMDESNVPHQKMLISNTLSLRAYSVFLVYGEALRDKVEEVYGTRSLINVSDMFIPRRKKTLQKNAPVRASLNFPVRDNFFPVYRSSSSDWNLRRLDVETLTPDKYIYVEMSGYTPICKASRTQLIEANDAHLFAGMRTIGIQRSYKHLLPLVKKRILSLDEFVFQKTYERWRDPEYRRAIRVAYIRDHILTHNVLLWLRENAPTLQYFAHPDMTDSLPLDLYNEYRAWTEGKVPRRSYLELIAIFSYYPNTFRVMPTVTVSEVKLKRLFDMFMSKYKVYGSHFDEMSPRVNTTSLSLEAATRSNVGLGGILMFPTPARFMHHYFTSV